MSFYLLGTSVGGLPMGSASTSGDVRPLSGPSPQWAEAAARLLRKSSALHEQRRRTGSRTGSSERKDGGAGGDGTTTGRAGATNNIASDTRHAAHLKAQTLNWPEGKENGILPGALEQDPGKLVPAMIRVGHRTVVRVDVLSPRTFAMLSGGDKVQVV